MGTTTTTQDNNSINRPATVEYYSDESNAIFARIGTDTTTEFRDVFLFEISARDSHEFSVFRIILILAF